MHLSVIIPTYERREVVLCTVAALDRQQDAPPFEVVVVVDGSTDGTASALRALSTSFPLVVLEQSNRGRAAACNRGSAAAAGDLLLFLDDDMEADARLLAEHAGSHASVGHPAVVMGHIPLHPDSPAGFLSCEVGRWAAERSLRLAEESGDIAVSEMLTGQTSLPARVFDAVGGFDEAFTAKGEYGNEDLDLGMRLRDAGCRVIFNPRAVSHQRYIVTPRQNLRQRRQAGKADVAFAHKHPGRARTIFREHAEGRIGSRWVWRGLLAVPVAGTVVATALTEAVLRTAEAFPRLPLMRPYRGVRNLAYWRGVRDAGGVPRAGTVVVLAYHSVSCDSRLRLGRFGLSPQRFGRQLDLLRAFGVRFLTPQQFLAVLDGSSPSPPRGVLVTFDDCYEDLATNAVPQLIRRGIPAVAFAVSDHVGGHDGWHSQLPGPPLPLMDAAGLDRLPHDGVEVGAHSRSHPKLPFLSPEEVEKEVVGSVRGMAELGLPAPRLFAYPYGEHDAVVREAVRSAGLIGGFTTASGRVTASTDRYAIPRVEVYARDTPALLAARVVLAGRLPAAVTSGARLARRTVTRPVALLLRLRRPAD